MQFISAMFEQLKSAGVFGSGDMENFWTVPEKVDSDQHDNG